MDLFICKFCDQSAYDIYPAKPNGVYKCSSCGMTSDHPELNHQQFKKLLMSSQRRIRQQRQELNILNKVLIDRDKELDSLFKVWNTKDIDKGFGRYTDHDYTDADVENIIQTARTQIAKIEEWRQTLFKARFNKLFRVLYNLNIRRKRQRH